MTTLEKLRAQLRGHGYADGADEMIEVSKEQLERIHVGGGDWFESFSSGPDGRLGPFWQSIWHTGVQQQ